jgi:light-regulated signal transduction histidine kinase (bacteriophytochrome)
MDKLISDLLQLSRTSRDQMNKSYIDMKSFVNTVYKETATSEEIENVVFELQELHPAEADPSLLRQVWKNLLSNALKYSRNNPQPIIKVKSVISEGAIKYSVEDNGAGFKQAYAHKIFNAFQRLHRPEDFEGTGIGLAIVQRIVHRHGGEVGAQSEEHKGAKIWFSLPATNGSKDPLAYSEGIDMEN